MFFFFFLGTYDKINSDKFIHEVSLKLHYAKKHGNKCDLVNICFIGEREWGIMIN